MPVNHVLLYAGEDADGNMLWVHCASGTGVVLNSPDYVTQYRRKHADIPACGRRYPRPRAEISGLADRDIRACGRKGICPSRQKRRDICLRMAGRLWRRLPRNRVQVQP